jgi:hypothetical protein
MAFGQAEKASDETPTTGPPQEKGPRDENEESQVQQHGAGREFEPPDGGLKAWLVVLAGFLVFANTWYVLYTSSAQDKHHH